MNLVSFRNFTRGGCLVRSCARLRVTNQEVSRVAKERKTGNAFTDGRSKKATKTQSQKKADLIFEPAKEATIFINFSGASN